MVKVGLEDAEEVLSVINTSNRQAYREIMPKKYYRDPVLSLEELAQQLGEMDFFVFREGRRILGVAALRVEAKDLGMIRWVYVLPTEQRKGIGTALIRHIEEEAKSRGITELRLRANERAIRALRFYEKLGCRSIDKVQRPWGVDVIMERRLKDTK